MPKVIDHHAALIYVMVTVSAVDGRMTDVELKRIGNLVSQLPVFRDFDINKLSSTAQTCGQILADREGLDTVLGLVKASLPEHLRETAYALAVEVAAIDLDVRQEELRFLEMLRDRLELSKLVVAAIERGARARHRIA
jgi:tellurite resistance protein